MDDLKLFVPFEKKDNDQRIVAGYASTEALDSQGEIVKLTALEKALPDYMKYANIREMHQWSAVGKAIQAKIDVTKRGLYLVAKVVDQNAWIKCKEGVYNGFSIGGRILKKVGDAIEELALNEISLVDRPANPEAVFSLVKFAGKEVPMKKAEDMPEEDGGEENNHQNIFIADRLVKMASEIAYMCNINREIKRDYAHLEMVLKSIKEAAVTELQLEKREKELAKEKEDSDMMKMLSEIKEQLAKGVSSKNRNSNWATPYFEQMQKTV